MKPALVLFLLASAALLSLTASPAHAQVELTETDPPDGATISAAPEVVRLCFSEPVIIEDNTTFRFNYIMPEERGLGMRIVFQPDGLCVDLHPGLPEERPEGEYRIQWQVTGVASGDLGSGTVTYQVTESTTGEPETPPAETPDPDQAPPDTDDDDGPDVVFLALITVAAVAGAGLLFTLGYGLRKRIGFEPHRPEEGDEGGGEDH